MATKLNQIREQTIVVQCHCGNKGYLLVADLLKRGERWQTADIDDVKRLAKCGCNAPRIIQADITTDMNFQGGYIGEHDLKWLKPAT